MVDLDDPVVRANALAQTHPFGDIAYRYVGAMIAQERSSQPGEELGVWAGHALTAGYCLRRIEEDRAGRRVALPPGHLPVDRDPADLDPAELDPAVRHVAGLIRTEGAEPYLLGEEADVIDLLDRMIASEIQRRVAHWCEELDPDSYEELVEYLAWWVIKGYALRVVEPVG